MADYSQELAQYQRLRKVGIHLSSQLVRSIDKDVLDEGGRKLGFLHKNTLVFRTEDESNVLMDYCIYNVRRNGQNAVQRYLASSSYPAGSDEMLLLQADCQARYSIFVVKEILPGVGVEALDIFRQDTVLILDLGFSRSAVAGLPFATRLIPVEKFWMTGGAALPVTATGLEKIQRHMSTLPPRRFGSKPTQLPLEEQDDLVAFIVRSCLEDAGAPQIRYQDVGEAESQASVPGAPLTKTTSVGRNAPCPCGSGKKYKKCCGG